MFKMTLFCPICDIQDSAGCVLTRDPDLCGFNDPLDESYEGDVLSPEDDILDWFTVDEGVQIDTADSAQFEDPGNDLDDRHYYAYSYNPVAGGLKKVKRCRKHTRRYKTADAAARQKSVRRNCAHMPTTLCWVDSYLFFQSSLSKVTETTKRDIANGHMDFQTAYPHWHRFLKDREYFNCIEERLLYAKLPFPYLLMESFSFLSSTDKIHSWPVDKRGTPAPPEDVQTLDHVREGLKRWKARLTDGRDDQIEFMSIAAVYLFGDTVGLFDRFAEFSQSNHNKFHMDPMNTVSLPQYCIKILVDGLTEPKPLITNSSIYSYFLRSILGGGCYGGNSKIFKRNLRNETNYNPKRAQSYLLSLDFCALYSHSLSGHLYDGNFRFLSHSELEHLEKDIKENRIHESWSDECATERVCTRTGKILKIGYLLEVSLYLNPRYHNSMQGLPLILTKTAILSRRKKSFVL